MQELNVRLGSRSYPIIIGAGALVDKVSLAKSISGHKCVIVTNDTVGPLYLSKLRDAIRKVGADSTEVVLPDGEQFKNAESLNVIHTAMLESRCDRTTTVIALGGGVVGDLAGFAAATYQRGVSFIQVPTTLLSQVDSSVGGKTGINHPLGKNMIGAFWQPKLVLSDTGVLATLPDRELSAGLAEVIKYGLIRDLPFLEWLESNMLRLMARDQVALTYAIERSCANKAEVVTNDELETAKEGGRALLNLGHTFGHAIETGMGYGTWLHGEAVAAGTIIAATLSMQLGYISAAELVRIKTLFQLAGLPVASPALGSQRYLELMSHDKKVLAGKLRLILLHQLGQAETVSGVATDQICKAIEDCCDH